MFLAFLKHDVCLGLSAKIKYFFRDNFNLSEKMYLYEMSFSLLMHKVLKKVNAQFLGIFYCTGPIGDTCLLVLI